MDGDLKWVVGLAVSVVSLIIAAFVGAFRNLATRISDSSKDVNGRIDDVKEKYVRRDDLNSHLQRLDAGLHDLREDMSKHNAQVLAAIASARSNSQ